MYGYGLPDGMNIIRLLQELEKIEDLRWIRLMYLYPACLENDLIDYLWKITKHPHVLTFHCTYQRFSVDQYAPSSRQGGRSRP
ncbi:MAG: hypothetical protein IPH75_16345 [bacterium]|nr:hypothetical protein [bacterium]